MPPRYKHINPQSVIDAVGGDHATFLHLVGMFLNSTPAARDQLQAALAADQREPASRLAHQIRGNAIIFGATELAGALSALEQSLHEGTAPLEQAEQCLALIEAVLAEMRAAVEHGGA
jgi:HPt (histidine-containing phosphotransfer) domain-containing protein